MTAYARETMVIVCVCVCADTTHGRTRIRRDIYLNVRAYVCWFSLVGVDNNVPLRTAKMTVWRVEVVDVVIGDADARF